MAANTAIQFVGPAVRLALGLVMAGVLSRYLGPHGLGAYALVFAYVGIFNGVFNDFGLGSTCLRQISRAPGRRAMILSSAAALQLLVSAATYILLLLGLLLAHFPTQVSQGAAIYGLTLLTTPVDLLALVFYAELRLQKLLGPALVGSLVMFLLTLAAVFWHAPLLVLVLSAIAGVAAQYAWILKRALTATAFIHRPSFALWPGLIREALPLSLNSIATAVAQQAPLLALSIFSLSAVGLFSAAGKIPLQLLIVPAVIRTTTYPLLSAAWVADRERFGRLLHHAIALSLLAAGPLAVGGVGLARVVIPLIFGTGFQGSVEPFQWLLLVSALLFPGILIGEALVATDHQQANLLLSVATLPLLVVLLLLWTPYSAATGAAAALLTYYGIQVAATAVVAHRLLSGGLQVSRLLPSAGFIVVGVLLALTVGTIQPLAAVSLACATLTILAALNRDTVASLVGAMIPRFSGHLGYRPRTPGS
jgi:O-antigen/teichoic acid export membrane protein